MTDENDLYIKCVAILGEDDYIHYKDKPARHSDVINDLLEFEEVTEEYIKNCKQGFLTNKREFVDRFQAMDIAIDAKQTINNLKRNPDYKEPLISEDLW